MSFCFTSVLLIIISHEKEFQKYGKTKLQLGMLILFEKYDS